MPGLEPNSGRVVVIAGATGFIGRRLIDRLRGSCRIIGLTRDADRAAEKHADLGIEWRSCDLFSMSDAEAALEGATHAYYLVHSMAPSARLNQASFADLDLILADNFSRAAAEAGLEQIIYLGGLVPEGELSSHLRSRLEVEQQLGAHGVPVTALRAGLVIGPEGSSFLILRRLVERLPIMALPAWTRTPTTPIGLEDCVELLARSLGEPAVFGRHGDIGGGETMTYESMIRRTAAGMGLRRRFLRVPLLSPGMSRAWVTLVTGAPRALVKPLVSSLEYEMVARDMFIQDHLRVEPASFEASLAVAVEQVAAAPATPATPRPRRRRGQTPKDVRSVQRLPNPQDRPMRWVAREYARWLPRFMWPVIRVDEVEDGRLDFRFAFMRRPLLELSLASDRSLEGRELYYITGGLLADRSRNRRGRLEFRRVLGGSHLLAAIHDFTPRLPWYIYLWTQAVAHLIVMRAFGRHLAHPDRYLGPASTDAFAPSSPRHGASAPPEARR